MAFQDLATPFTQRWKEYELNNSGVSLWENYLKGVQETYQPQITAYQQQAAYDISGAFANYKQQQRNILQNQRLESSLKQQLSGQLEDRYESAYTSATAQAASKLADVAQAYAKEVATGEKQFAELGQMSAKTLERLYEYASDVYGTTYDINEALLGEGGSYGFYSIDPATGTRTLTEKGLDFYDKLLNKQTTTFNKETGAYDTRSFRDWLRYKEYDDEADFYESNYAQFADILGGKGLSDLEYTSDESWRVAASDAEQRYKKLGGDLLKESNFKSNEEKAKYYESESNYLASKNIDYDYYSQIPKNSSQSDAFKKQLKTDVVNVLNINEDAVNIIQPEDYYRHGNYQIEIDKDSVNEEQLQRLKNSGDVFESGGKYKINLNSDGWRPAVQFSGGKYTTYQSFFNRLGLNSKRRR